MQTGGLCAQTAGSKQAVTALLSWNAAGGCNGRPDAGARGTVRAGMRRPGRPPARAEANRGLRRAPGAHRVPGDQAQVMISKDPRGSGPEAITIRSWSCLIARMLYPLLF